MLDRWRSGFLQIVKEVAALGYRYLCALWRLLCAWFSHRKSLTVTPSDALATVRLKTTRAADHLEDFKANFKGRHGPIFPPNSVGVHLHPDRQGITVHTSALQPNQQRWLGILIGDVIHQLRAALDHIVYALATRGGKTLTEDDVKKLEFIIRKNSRDFGADRRVSKGWFEQIIGRDELAAVEAAQPYQRDPVVPESDPLWILRELDNIDKHRTFVVIQNQIRVPVEISTKSGKVYTETFEIATATQPVKANTQLFSFSYTAPEPIATVEMKDQPTRNILFSEQAVPGCVGREVFGLAREMIRITEAIIPTFDKFFP